MADAVASTPPALTALVAETPSTGLTSAQVAERRSRGLANAGGERTSRSVAEILRANILTRFNFILGVLLAVILVTGQPQDALFGIVLVTNALIGIAQELRAKRTLDRLAVLSAPRVRVIRDGAPQGIAVADLVAGDLVDLRAGDQLVADGVVRASASLEADESLLTGESEPVGKRAGDRLLSGGFVVAGSGGYQATGVGADAYARKLAAQARRFALVRSELMDGINRILRYVTWAIGPVAVLLVISGWHAHGNMRQVASGTVAALVGMVPQGLVLLTSVAFGVAAVTLARRRVLVQQLPAVEGLARVDVVCLDKTGTLTDGTVGFDSLIRLDGQAPAGAALGALADDENRNATLAAVGQAFPPPEGWPRQAAVPFSSARKWSAASFAGHGTWVLGAPEMVLPGGQQDQLSQAAGLAASGRRVLVLAHAAGPLDGESLPQGLRAVAFVLLAERLRSDAAQAIAYFTAQGVALKVISGDSPLTVSAVAARAGLPDAGRPVDARDLPEDPGALGRLLEERSVFGRVTPQQKQAMVTALQARGHTVAMTGDGVNDVLALTGCRHNAKNTLVKNYLYLAERAGAVVYPETMAVAVRPLDHDGYAVDTVRTGAWRAGRTARTFTAGQVVFTAGTWGTQQLLHKMKAAGSLPEISAKLGVLTRTNSEALGGALTTMRNRKAHDFTNGVAITSSIHPDEYTHIEPVRYGKGSNAMGLLSTLMTDGGGQVPRWVKWLAHAARHPGQLASLYGGINHWSERAVIGLTMQTLDNSITVHPKRTILGRIKLTSTHGHGEPSPTWIPAANETMRRIAAKIGGFPLNSVGEMVDIPMTAHFLGGCVIGDSPDRGVVDPYHRMYGHPGLHVVDGSAISANLGVNPALTITAQAERAMAVWPNKDESDPRPPLGAAYRRVPPVVPRSPIVPPSAPAALRLPIVEVR